MDENAKNIQREIAKDKIQIILSSIALAVLVIMELYIMINFKSNFMAMAVGILLMILALFFLISALLDMSLKQKDIEQEKYEEIYNAQKASYLVIKKSFDEMDQRLRNIEENSSLPAEDIINAQKAVAKVTISRSKENTDALMNSNDELINQLVNIQEKLEINNSQMIEKQQNLLKETNFDIQQKIADLSSKISIMEGKIQNGVPVMAAQPVTMAQPVQQVQMEAPEPEIEPIVENVDDLSLESDIDIPIEEDFGIDMDTVIEDDVQEETITEDVEIDLDSAIEEPELEEAPVEEIAIEEPVLEEAPVEEIAIEEPVLDEAPAEEIALEEPVLEEAPVEEIAIEEPVLDEAPAEEIATEEPVLDEAPIEEIALEEPVLDEVPTEKVPEEDPGAGLDALLEDLGDAAIIDEPEPIQEETPVEEEPKEDDAVVIPDVGVDLTDPNRVMSPEEIEKLFASI